MFGIFFKKYHSVSDIVADLESKVEALHVHADNQAGEIVRQSQIAEDAETAKFWALTEMAKARAVADKIRALIEG